MVFGCPPSRMNSYLRDLKKRTNAADRKRKSRSLRTESARVAELEANRIRNAKARAASAHVLPVTLTPASTSCVSDPASGAVSETVQPLNNKRTRNASGLPEDPTLSRDAIRMRVRRANRSEEEIVSEREATRLRMQHARATRSIVDGDLSRARDAERKRAEAAKVTLAARAAAAVAAEAARVTSDGLVDACANGSIDVAYDIVRRGINVRLESSAGVLPLCAACSTEKLDCEQRLPFIHALLEAGADADNCSTALNPSCSSIHSRPGPSFITANFPLLSSIERLFIRRTQNYTPLIAAAGNRRCSLHHCQCTSIIRLLIANGATPSGHPTHDDWTPVHAAVSTGKSDVISELVHAGADINRGDYTPLHHAAACQSALSSPYAMSNPREHTTNLLLDLGASPDTPCRALQIAIQPFEIRVHRFEQCNAWKTLQWTPLDIAVYEADPRLVGRLLHFSGAPTLQLTTLLSAYLRSVDWDHLPSQRYGFVAGRLERRSAVVMVKILVAAGAATTGACESIKWSAELFRDRIERFQTSSELLQLHGSLARSIPLARSIGVASSVDCMWGTGEDLSKYLLRLCPCDHCYRLRANGWEGLPVGHR